MPPGKIQCRAQANLALRTVALNLSVAFAGVADV
jgi:hypothetical protein